MEANNKTKGATGETDAAEFLTARGYRLVDANVRPQGGMARGEIDLIAWHGEFLVFIEVKARRRARSAHGTPAEAIDARKRKQLVSLAQAYLAKHDMDSIPCRFDVVEVLFVPGRPPHVSLLANAFDATDSGD